MLAAANSIHTLRWCNALAERGYEIHLLTCHRVKGFLHEKVSIHYLAFAPFAGYFLNAPQVRFILARIRPALLHAHYASGYGTLGRLAGFHPYVVSVWGSDIYDVPDRSPFHHILITGNLRSADWICSTSNVMAAQTRKLVPVKHLQVTPFGVDTQIFSPSNNVRDQSIITIGTVKTLTPKYGVDLLIRAFAQLVERAKHGLDQSTKYKLLIVGDGPQRQELTDLVQSLEISELTEFIGSVPHSDVPKYLNQLDIYVAASRFDSESFGVAVLEASACGLPVIVSDAGGLPEVVKDNKTGIIVPRNNLPLLVEAIYSLATDHQLRIDLGQRGREHVRELYEWKNNVKLMEQTYACVLQVNQR